MTPAERATARLRLCLAAGKDRLAKTDDFVKLNDNACRFVHIDELPYYLPPAVEIHQDNRNSVLAMAALDLLLMREHEKGMVVSEPYRQWILAKPEDQRLIGGLVAQRNRFERQSARRHRDIWGAIRSGESRDRQEFGIKVSPGNTGAYRKRVAL